MITLYTDATPNGRRASIMLEEVGLPYQVQRITLGKGEHRQSDYLKINPAGQIPTIIDDGAIDSEALILTQTGAILIYLAEKSGKLLSKQPLDRARMWEWLALDITDISSTRFNAFLLTLRAGDSMKEGVEILRERAMMFYRLMDARLAETRYLAGDEISIADISAYPWAVTMQHPQMRSLENLRRWMDRVGQRPAVQRGMSIPA